MAAALACVGALALSGTVCAATELSLGRDRTRVAFECGSGFGMTGLNTLVADECSIQIVATLK